MVLAVDRYFPRRVGEVRLLVPPREKRAETRIVRWKAVNHENNVPRNSRPFAFLSKRVSPLARYLSAT